MLYGVRWSCNDIFLAVTVFADGLLAVTLWVGAYFYLWNVDLVVDCGEGTFAQLQRAKMKYTRITRIFITHMHRKGGLS